MRQSVRVIGGSTIIDPRWMISMLESGFKIGIMTCLIKRKMKKSDCPTLGMIIEMLIPKINLEWKIDHLEGVESEVRRRSADFREQCLDHHHHEHKTLMSHRISS